MSANSQRKGNKDYASYSENEKKRSSTIDDNQYVTDLNRKLRYNATCDELQAKHNKRSQDPFNRNIMHRNARARALVRNSFSDQKLQAKRRMQGHALLCL
jgi:hypothetical protein